MQLHSSLRVPGTYCVISPCKVNLVCGNLSLCRFTWGFKQLPRWRPARYHTGGYPLVHCIACTRLSVERAWNVYQLGIECCLKSCPKVVSSVTVASGVARVGMRDFEEGLHLWGVARFEGWWVARAVWRRIFSTAQDWLDYVLCYILRALEILPKTCKL